MKLGQHFLKNKNILKKIAEAANIENGDVVIEIGPGHGELTEELDKEFSTKADQPIARRIIAIEKDKNLVDFLKKKFESDKNIEIVEGDALKILPELTSRQSLVTSHYKLVGNIPYYITGYLFRIIGDLENKPNLAIFLIQKEVAERICAKPGEMNLLAASIQFWAEPELLFNVGKDEFSPPPEVESAVLGLKVKKDSKNADKNAYYRTIKAVFKQPRKTILNNLTGFGIDKESAKSTSLKIELKENSRPQDLSIPDIIKLSKLV
jgi:16S rRNA (adenine1518-N6/adenine1519-N6)-dimethyltransferase